jgi:hypothetical protein
VRKVTLVRDLALASRITNGSCERDQSHAVRKLNNSSNPSVRIDGQVLMPDYCLQRIRHLASLSPRSQASLNLRQAGLRR